MVERDIFSILDYMYADTILKLFPYMDHMKKATSGSSRGGVLPIRSSANSQLDGGLAMETDTIGNPQAPDCYC